MSRCYMFVRFYTSSKISLFLFGFFDRCMLYCQYLNLMCLNLICQRRIFCFLLHIFIYSGLFLFCQQQSMRSGKHKFHYSLFLVALFKVLIRLGRLISYLNYSSNFLLMVFIDIRVSLDLYSAVLTCFVFSFDFAWKSRNFTQITVFSIKFKLIFYVF